jgi:hypothetical protein
LQEGWAASFPTASLILPTAGTIRITGTIWSTGKTVLPVEKGKVGVSRAPIKDLPDEIAGLTLPACAR